MSSQDEPTPLNAFTWSSLKPKLFRLLDSQSPHVLANLAMLAAAMSDDPESLDELAKMAADAASAMVNRRGDTAETLATILEERRQLSADSRLRFDKMLQRYLEREISRWPAERITALLREKMPIDLLPIHYVVLAIAAAASGIPVEARSPQEVATLKDQRGRMREIRDAIALSDAEAWHARLSQETAKWAQQQDEDQRTSFMFGLLELWPELAQAVAQERIDGKHINILGAVKLGRSRVRTILGSTFLTCLCVALTAFLLPHAVTTLLQEDFKKAVGDTLMASAAYSILLTIMGITVGALSSFLYIPTGSVRLSLLRRFKINLPTVLACSFVSALVVAIVIAMRNVEGLLEGFGITLLCVFTSSALIMFLAPLLAAYQKSLNKRWNVINRLSVSALPLIVSAVLIWLLQPSDSATSSLLWANALAATVCLSTAAWLSESRRAGRWQLTSVPQRIAVAGRAATIGLALMTGLILWPTLKFVYSNFKPFEIDLDESSDVIAEIAPGAIHSTRTDRPFVLEVTTGADYSLEHSISSSTDGRNWETKSLPLPNAREITDAGSGKKNLITHYNLQAPQEVHYVCLDCSSTGRYFDDFFRIGWSLHKKAPLSAKILVGAKLGGPMTLDRYYLVNFEHSGCIVSERPIILRNESSDSDVVTENIDDMMISNIEDAAFVPPERDPVCAGGTWIEKGPHEVCLSSRADNSPESCNSFNPELASRRTTRSVLKFVKRN